MAEAARKPIAQPVVTTKDIHIRQLPVKLDSYRYFPVFKTFPIGPLTMSQKIEKFILTPRAIKNRKARLIKNEKAERARQEAVALELKKEKKVAETFLRVKDTTEVYSKPTLKVREEDLQEPRKLITNFRLRYANYRIRVNSLNGKESIEGKTISEIPWTMSCAKAFPRDAQRLGLEADLLQLWKLFGRKLGRKVLPEQLISEFCTCGWCSVERTPPWERERPDICIKKPLGTVPVRSEFYRSLNGFETLAIKEEEAKKERLRFQDKQKNNPYNEDGVLEIEDDECT